MFTNKFIQSTFESADFYITKTMQSAVNQLRQYREENSRSHDEAIELWSTILSKHDLSTLGDEKWLILEQIFKSALHCSQQALASDCLQQLTNQFKPTSRRVSILRAMFHEFTEEYDKAQEIYSTLLAENDTDAVVWKRQISLLKGQNRIRDAIRELDNYLKLYQVNRTLSKKHSLHRFRFPLQADHEGWSELCDLYLSERDYDKAAFCAEELLLANPHNHLYHERYASICYTNRDYDKARTYYFSTIQLNPTNMRALFGILLTSINNKSRSTIDNDQLIREEIFATYREKMPELLPIVEKQLQHFLPT